MKGYEITTTIVLLAVIFGIPLGLLVVMAVSELVHQIKKSRSGATGCGNHTLDELLAMAGKPQTDST